MRKIDLRWYGHMNNRPINTPMLCLGQVDYYEFKEEYSINVEVRGRPKTT